MPPPGPTRRAGQALGRLVCAAALRAGAADHRDTGQPIDRFVGERLFAPLGIAAFDRQRGFDGKPLPASGLRLAPRDLAQVGRMLLDGGRGQGRSVVPEAWVRESLSGTVAAVAGFRYGHQFWAGRYNQLDNGRPSRLLFEAIVDMVD